MKKILQNAFIIPDKIINNIVYKMRVDINDYCKDYFEANILRVILYNKGTFIRKNLLDKINVIIDINGIFFNKINTQIIVNPSIDEINIIKQHNLIDICLIVLNETSLLELSNLNKLYTSFQNEYQSKIPLWETKKQNVDVTPDLYKKQWIIGKKETKRKYKKVFSPQGQLVKIGQLWQKQPFKGRPYYDKMFMDNFKIYDKLTNNVIFEHTNWGSIILQVRRYLKSNAMYYYNNNNFLICSGHVKKIDKWVDIIQYNTISNLYLNIEHFL